MNNLTVVGVALAGLAALAMALCFVLDNIGRSLDRIARTLESGIVQTRDVERAKVYSEHLGEKLRGSK